MAPIVNEHGDTQELAKRVGILEEAVRDIKLEFAVHHSEIMGELRGIKDYMAQISLGNNPTCLKQNARLDALEKTLFSKADASFTETTRKSLYACWAVVSSVSLTIISLMIVHLSK